MRYSRARARPRSRPNRPHPPRPSPLQAGGWGSIEYGTVGFTDGQVVGGRWKALQHFSSSFLLKDAFLACGDFGAGAGCFARNDDALRALDAVATVTLARVSGAGAVVAANATRVALPRGAGAVQWWCLGAGDVATGACEPAGAYLARMGCAASGADCVLFTALADAASGAPIAASFELLGLPGALALADPGLSWAVAAGANADGSVNVTVAAAAAPAAFVTLTTLAQGRFDDNVFWLPAAGAARTVRFIPFGALDRDLLATTLRVEHLQQYL